MHAAGPRARLWSQVTWIPPQSPRSIRRTIHQSRCLNKDIPSNASPPADDGKPVSKPENDQNVKNSHKSDSAADTVREPQTRRVRSSAFTSGRQRPGRPKAGDDLPPVRLPRSFLDDNFLTRCDKERRNILSDDPIWHRGYLGAQWLNWLWHDMALVFFEAAWDESLLHSAPAEMRHGNIDAISRRCVVIGEAVQWLDRCLRDVWASELARSPPTTKSAKELSIDFRDAKNTSPVVSLILSPDRHFNTRRGSPRSKDKQGAAASDDSILRSQIRSYIAEGSSTEGSALVEDPESPVATQLPTLESHGSQIFDAKLLGEATAAVRAELSLLVEPALVRREPKRPLLVLNTPNYNGIYPSIQLLERIATQVDSDLLRIDAQDLASIVGRHLGQDTAYTRGSMSMLGYRVAEMNGRLEKGPETQGPNDEDMPGDIEATWVNIRQHSSGSPYKSPFEEELQKIKEDARDYVLPSVDRWENLKISAALEEMIHAALTKRPIAARPLLIHVHNFVELNMTLEGSLLLGRLRTIVDAFWRNGKAVVLVGTSANDEPSEQYLSALGEIGAEECVISFPLRHRQISGWESLKERREALDYLRENLRNIEAMSTAMYGPHGPAAAALNTFFVRSDLSPELLAAMEATNIDISRTPLGLASTILPCSEVYHIARLYHGHRHLASEEPSHYKTFLDVIQSKSVASKQDQNPTAEDEKRSAASNSTDFGTKQKPEAERPQAGIKYNEFEKKLLSGLIDRDEIRTTFADVHAPPETIAALKLLTSLSLVRPEAFSYGVLANDRIPGCLLYGPPGTGKTLLAKAVAKESGANMLEVSGASINDMYVGQSEKNVRALFSLAKKLSPLVIFIDEADALFAARGQSRSRPAHRETINQFLREWDGMSDAKAFIMVATNRPFDLDDAILRRLPRKILVDLPLQADRAAILSILLKDEKLDDSVSIDGIARSTVLYSGSDLKNLCVAAAMAAVQEELEDASRHLGPEPYVYPEKRTLAQRHFTKAAEQIAASISEDMDSLKAIRKFDQKYGDQRVGSRRAKAMGFGVTPRPADAEDARVRQPALA